MVFKVLAIGDLANGFVDLRKYVKNSKIDIINFPWDTASKLTESKDVEFFKSMNTSFVLTLEFAEMVSFGVTWMLDTIFSS